MIHEQLWEMLLSFYFEKGAWPHVIPMSREDYEALCWERGIDVTNFYGIQIEVTE